MSLPTRFLTAAAVGVLAILCIGFAAGCGTSTDPVTSTPPPPPPPNDQGLQVSNSNLSLVAITRIGVENVTSGSIDYTPYAVPPGSTGTVIQLAVGNYNYWAEYVVGGIFQFTQAFGFSVQTGAVTFRTIIIQ